MAELAKSYKFLLLTITVLAFGVIFFGNGQAKAANAEWPGNSWGADTEISIRLSQNKNHPSPLGTNTTFILWSKTPGSKSVDIVKTLCGDKNGSEARVTPRSDTSQKKVFSQGNCGNKTITLPTFDNEELVGDTKYYKYLVDVELRGSSPNDNQWLGDKIAFFQFRVSYDDAGGDTKVGFKSKPGGNALPFISTKGGQTYLPNINIPVGQCSGNDTAIQKYQIYDSDNNKNLFAQPDDYRPVKYKLSNATAVWNWDNWESNTAPLLEKLYWPVDGSSGGVRSIGYAIASSYEGKQPSERPHFRIKDLGGGNYTVIGFPFDELPIDCPLPPPPPDPCLGTDCKYNWAIAGKSEVQSLAAIGDTVTFNNDQYPASVDGWNSDINTTDTVEAKVIMTYNGAQIGSYDFTTYYPNNPAITKSRPISKKLNQTGRYCTYIHYPVGFLGKRKAPNYDTDGSGPKSPSGHTYRWVYIPGRDVGPFYDINRANRNMSVPGGGYGQWWLGSTTDETPNGATDQYWSFHDFNGGGGEQLDGGVANNWRWESKDIDNNEEGRKLWEVYGWWNPNTNTYNSWPFSFNSACVDVIDPDPGVDVSDYEKGTGDKTVTHNIDLGVTTCPAYSATVIVDAFVTGNESDRFYSEPVTANFGGSNCTWSLPKQISGANLDARPPGTSVTVRTNIVSSDKDGQEPFVVYEVPFARFYGNDVYSTNGQLKFNDSNNAAFDAKGSVAQYAAFAAGDTNYLDTAGYRKDLLSPNPPTGLSSNRYPFHSSINAEKVYNDTESNLPINCGNYAGGSLPATGCFNATGNPTTINGSTYNTKTTIKGQNIVIDGNISNTSFDPSAASVARVYQHILYNTRPWEAGGYSSSLSVGNYVLNSTNTPFINDISSLSVGLGYRVTAYDSGGNSISFTGNDDNLLDNSRGVGNWNDAIVRLVVEKLPTANYNVDATGVLLIIADNIFINKTVERIDAILIARNAIYTCTNGTAPITNSSLEDPNNCRKTLTINGSISAPNIAFQRVGGSRYLNQGVGDTADGASNCAAWKGVKNCGARGDIDNPSGKTAEIINFPAYLYWAKPYLVNQSGSGGTYDSLNLTPPRQ